MSKTNMSEIARKIISVALTGMLLLSALAVTAMPSAVSAGKPVLPTSFYGNVTINGTPAPVDTIVTGKIVGAVGSPGEGNITVIEAGKYGKSGIWPDSNDNLFVKTDDSGDSNKTIEFYVQLPSWGEGKKANETAIYDSAAAAHKLDLTVTVYNLTVNVTPSDGGDGGDGEYPISVTIFGNTSTGQLYTNGNLVEAITATSEDGKVAIYIPGTTACLDEDGNRLTNMSASEQTDLPEVPEDYYIIGDAYNLQPPGATFDPYLELTLSYEDSDIPQGVFEEDLYIVCYDGEWKSLDGDVDTINNTITAQAEHFTTFAIMGGAEAAPPTAANFTVSSLTLSSEQVKPGQGVTVTVDVTNIGGNEGSYAVNLTVNGTVEQTQTVTLAPSATETVAFTVVKEELGTYSVSVDGLTKEFTVAAPSWLSQYWWTIVVGVVIVGLLVYFLWWRRREAA